MRKRISLLALALLAGACERRTPDNRPSDPANPNWEDPVSTAAHTSTPLPIWWRGYLIGQGRQQGIEVECLPNGPVVARLAGRQNVRGTDLRIDELHDLVEAKLASYTPFDHMDVDVPEHGVAVVSGLVQRPADLALLFQMLLSIDGVDEVVFRSEH
jgi:hypothetical protein